jgi:hypothetical protein
MPLLQYCWYMMCMPSWHVKVAALHGSTSTGPSWHVIIDYCSLQCLA